MYRFNIDSINFSKKKKKNIKSEKYQFGYFNRVVHKF